MHPVSISNPPCATSTIPLAIVADCDRSVRRVTARMFARSGLSPYECGSLEAAAAAIVATPVPVACVLLDAYLPGLKRGAGLGYLRRLAPHTPIIVTSSLAEGELDGRLQLAGATAVLEKPYTLDDLRGTIATLLWPARDAA